MAFYLARRAATRRYTYGFGKADDVAGIFIVLSIAVSAGVALWQSVARLIYPIPMTDLGWVAAAAMESIVHNDVVTRSPNEPPGDVRRTMKGVGLFIAGCQAGRASLLLHCDISRAPTWLPVAPLIEG